ncbi:MAG: DUF3326 domain-containing protein [Candidatus Gastranaerophilaceae bacterium]
MLDNNEKLGAFIVPTGIGASIGGFAGDASPYARKFTQLGKLIVNPNVVNAGCFSGINDKMLYVEGYSLDEFFKGKLSLKETTNNKIGVVFDKAIPKDVLNVHINTINAVKAVYGIDIYGYEVTKNNVGVEFYVNEQGISTGYVSDVTTLKNSAINLINQGCNAIAIVCLFDDETNEDYENGVGVDPVGGVEAILSHYISKELEIPCAHSPAFCNFQISPKLVSGKSASEYITPTFLPCILIGLNQAPLLNGNITIDNLDYLIMPANALGSIPVFEALKRNIPVYAVNENVTLLNVTNESINKKCGIKIVDTYDECMELIANGK